MPREFSRTQRVGAEMQRILSELIRSEVTDSKLGMITINDVVVSRDFAHAKVYLTFFNADYAIKESIGILNQKAPYLRHLLGQNMRLRTVPALHFHYDKSLENGERINALLNQI